MFSDLWIILRVDLCVWILLKFSLFFHREIVVYVERVEAPKTTGKSQLFKFYVNNDDGKEIQCVVWGDTDISALKNIIELNKVI